MKCRHLFLGALTVSLAGALSAAVLTLERTIPLPGVEGRIDHFALDAAGHRLFVAALGNNSVEVVDLVQGTVVHSLSELAEPQGVAFEPERQRLYVANGGDGTVRIFDARTWAEVGGIKVDDDADNLRFDARMQRLYVGNGSGALSVIDLTRDAVVGRIPLAAHPEAFQLQAAGSRIFVNVPGAQEVAVVDREKNSVVAHYALGLAGANFPLALDESRHRLFVGCRVPARLLVFDTESGARMSKLNLHGDCDDFIFDPARRQLYATCGEGFIDIFTRSDSDHWELKEAVRTEPGARTGCCDGDRLYLAVPKRGDRAAEIRCYVLEK